jgi:hypothetical protein
VLVFDNVVFVCFPTRTENTQRNECNNSKNKLIMKKFEKFGTLVTREEAKKIKGGGHVDSIIGKPIGDIGIGNTGNNCTNQPIPCAVAYACRVPGTAEAGTCKEKDKKCQCVSIHA